MVGKEPGFGGIFRIAGFLSEPGFFGFSGLPDFFA
jgi:hypothetical protein